MDLLIVSALGSAQLRDSPAPRNEPLLRALWSLLDGIWGLLKDYGGVLGPYSEYGLLVYGLKYISLFQAFGSSVSLMSHSQEDIITLTKPT